MGLVESALAGLTDFFCFYDLWFWGFFSPSFLAGSWMTYTLHIMYVLYDKCTVLNSYKKGIPGAGN